MFISTDDRLTERVTVQVMDMDWHARDAAYSWNTSIVPDPAAWMGTLHSDKNPLGHPLKYLVNLHPNGVGASAP